MQFLVEFEIVGDLPDMDGTVKQVFRFSDEKVSWREAFKIRVIHRMELGHGK